MKWNAAKNFKCTFNTSPSYWRLGGNPSFLFLSFLALQPLVYLWVCVCVLVRVCVATFISPHRLLRVRGGVWGGWECNGNHFFVTAPRVWRGCCRGLLDWSCNMRTHTHTCTQALKKICYMDRIHPPLLALPPCRHLINDPNMWIKISKQLVKPRGSRDETA